MNCNCITRINQQLKDEGQEYQLAPTLVLGGQAGVKSVLSLRTVWTDPSHKGRKPPPAIICPNCPFCRRGTGGGKL